LASASPRRRELLQAAGYVFDVVPARPAAETEPGPGETPAAIVTRLAVQKAADVREQLLAAPDDRQRLVVACDTIVECQGQILGKPRDVEHANWMLSLLSGQEHHVWSGLCLWPVESNRYHVKTAVSSLRMDPLTPGQIDEYLASGQWEGKAGAFGYQDRLEWLHLVRGSESNVVGLPLELLQEMLAQS
jgi:septum formation protein